MSWENPWEGLSPRSPDRIDRMLEKLRVLWHQKPDLRLGQLVENLGESYSLGGKPSLYYLEDDKMEKRIENVIELDWHGAREIE